jgi:hypothetical protein
MGTSREGAVDKGATTDCQLPQLAQPEENNNKFSHL